MDRYAYRDKDLDSVRLIFSHHKDSYFLVSLSGQLYIDRVRGGSMIGCCCVELWHDFKLYSKEYSDHCDEYNKAFSAIRHYAPLI